VGSQANKKQKDTNKDKPKSRREKNWSKGSQANKSQNPTVYCCCRCSILPPPRLQCHQVTVLCVHTHIHTQTQTPTQAQTHSLSGDPARFLSRDRGRRASLIRRKHLFDNVSMSCCATGSARENEICPRRPQMAKNKSVHRSLPYDHCPVIQHSVNEI